MSVDLLAEGALPSGWEKVSLGLFRQQTTSSFNPAAHGTSHFELYSVPSHELGRPEVVLGSAIGSNKQYVAPGDVLISKINPRLNRAWVVGNFTNHPKIASTEWIVFKRSDAVDSQLLCGILQSFRIRDFLAHNASGVGGSLTRAKPALVDQITIGLPPVAEQQRIVAKIEELFSELDKGIESLKTAQAQLKVYRQALLKHAFEGKLTAQWRADNPDKLETAEALLARIQRERAERYRQQIANWEAGGKQGSKPKAPKPLPPLTAEELAELPELPEGWGWVSIELLLSIDRKPMATGPFGTLLSKADHRPTGLPVLGIENIGNGVFTHGNKIFVSEQKAKELEPFRVAAGDVVISRSGTVGEICKIPEGLGRAFISTNLIRVTLNRSVISEDYFVYLFQGGGSVKQQVKSLCKGSSREFLNQGILSEIAFPLPCIEEQREIVSVLEEKLSEADQLDQTLATALQQSEALRQSILKKAFSAQLVPQDPADEPATALLERIQAEQAATPQKKKTRQ